MKENALKKLNRQDLLRLLLDSEKENLRLTHALEDANQKLEDRRIILSESGSLADAVVRINGLMESAQRTADEYRQNVEQTCRDALAETRRLVEQARERCGAQDEPEEWDRILASLTAPGSEE